MNLSELLRKEYLVCNLKAATRDDALKELLSLCDLSMEDFSFDDVFSELLEREEEQTTGIGEGIAFPHARLTGLSKIHILIGISQKGIDFNAMDRKPVNFFVMMLVNRIRPNDLLTTRAAIIKLLMKPGVKEKMLEENSPDAVWEIIRNSEIKVDYEITAKDIMRPYVSHILPNATISDAARELHKHHIDSLPVIDENNIFRGEISCYDLFSYGLPEFFNSLHVISFVKHMNPFEKYFHVDKTKHVTDLLAGKALENSIISADATLMEIVFEMTVKNKEFLYVLSEDGKLRGILDRYSIIDKILIAR